MIRLCQTNYVCIIKNYIYVNPSENGVVEEISLIDGENSICVSKIKKIFILKHRKSLKKTEMISPSLSLSTFVTSDFLKSRESRKLYVLIIFRGLHFYLHTYEIVAEVVCGQSYGNADGYFEHIGI